MLRDSNKATRFSAVLAGVLLFLFVGGAAWAILYEMSKSDCQKLRDEELRWMMQLQDAVGDDSLKGLADKSEAQVNLVTIRLEIKEICQESAD